MPLSPETIAVLMEKQIEDVGKMSDEMLKDPSARYKMLFRDINSTKQVVELASRESAGSATLHLDRTQINEFDPVTGKRQRIRQLAWGLGFSYGFYTETFDGGEKIIAQATEDMGLAPLETVNTLAIALYTYGNGSLAVPQSKGVPLFSNKAISGQYIFNTAHGFNNSNITNSNYLSSTSLDKSGLETVTNTPRGWMDELGRRTSYKVTCLVVPTNLRHDVAELLKSEYDPETANNTYNSARENFKPGDYKVLDELPSGNVFYALTNVPSRLMPTVRWGQKPKTTKGFDINTASHKTINMFAFSLEHSCPYASIRVGG